MARITVSVDIEAAADRVWAEAADLAAHAEWMTDAESIEFLTEHRSGAGTRMRVATRVGPFRTVDIMTVTRWVEGETIGVSHEGLITGEGDFTLQTINTGTRFTWSERLSFPWYLGGPMAAWAARPILQMIWRRNLDRLRERF